MKVIHYKRSAESNLHMHAGSYADMSYIPEKNIVIFNEQHGTFGGFTLSISEDNSILEEAKAVSQGNIQVQRNLEIYSVKEMDYDETKLTELIENARLRKDLDGKVASAYHDLFDEAFGYKVDENEEIQPLDPKTLDEATKERLMKIITDKVKADWAIPQYKKILYSEDTKKIEYEETEKNLKNQLKSFQKDRHFNLEDMMGCIEQARKINIDTSILKGFAKLVYDNYNSPECHEEFKIATEILEVSEEEIIASKVDPLYKAMVKNFMICFNMGIEMYIQPIIKYSKGMPQDVTSKIAEKAIRRLLSEGDSSEFKEPSFLVQSLMLAKHYLSEEEYKAVQETVSKIIYFPKENRVYMNRECGENILEHNLLPGLTHLIAIEIYNGTLWNQNFLKRAMEIQSEYQLTDDEIKKEVNDTYHNALKQGNLSHALGLRQNYDHLIDDKSIPIADIELLVRVNKHHS